MPTHSATISWSLNDPQAFAENRYSRRFRYGFDGGVTMPGSPALAIVPAPYADPAAVDPEEAYVAAIAGCHMLWFLNLAQHRGYIVASYDDEAVGYMTRDAATKVDWVSRVELRPRIGWADPQPTDEDIAALHERAHQRCFIANSVKTDIVILAPA